MGFSKNVIEKAKTIKDRTLVLPESTDKRMLEATKEILSQKICEKIQLIGDKDIINSLAKEYGIQLNDQIEIINPLKDARKDKFINTLVAIRTHKGMTEEKASITMENPLFYGAMLVKHEYASAMVAGAINTTANVLRSAIWIVGTAENSPVISSCFVMESSEKKWGHNGQMIFSDCGIIPRPNANELAAIAVASAKSCRTFLEIDPIISLLSFSSKGSAEHQEIDKVREALSLVKKLNPELVIDGELQMDAAINERVAKLKAPNSPSAGKSNTLVFPDLNSGNIAYKTAQVFGNMNAYGPIIQGLAAPINDLSRGCNTQEIVVTAALSLCQSAL